VVEQNLTRPNRPHGTVVIWDDQATGNMDPWSLLLLYLTVPGGRGLGLGRESNLKLETYFKNGKRGLGY